MIREKSTLREVAFEICTALEKIGVTAVLTGGSAATVYAPQAYQSRDLDFIVQFHKESARPGETLKKLGYSLRGQYYEHVSNSLTLDFPRGPLMIGSDYVQNWDTLRQGNRLLHILSPTDCCRDRLAGFLFWNDFSALGQALAVARIKKSQIKMKTIRSWCIHEDAQEKFEEFARRLAET